MGQNKPEQVCLANKYTADLSMFSFIKVIAKINKLEHILEYRKDEALKARMPGY